MSLPALWAQHELDKHQPREEEDEGCCQAASEADNVGNDRDKESKDEGDKEPHHALHSQADPLQDRLPLVAVSTGCCHRSSALQQERRVGGGVGGGGRGGVAEGGAAWRGTLSAP